MMSKLASIAIIANVCFAGSHFKWDKNFGADLNKARSLNDDLHNGTLPEWFNNELKIDIQYVVDVCKRAGDAQMKIYNTYDEFSKRSDMSGKADDDILSAWQKHKCNSVAKEDESPQTAADREADKIIKRRLQLKYSNIPILSEEDEEAEKVTNAQKKQWKYFWCVDPLDGTKEFNKRNGEFTVNVALIDNKNGGVPIFGVVYVPAHDKMYYGYKGNAFKVENYSASIINQDGFTKIYSRKTRIKCDNFSEKDSGLTIVASASHNNDTTKEFISRYADPKRKSMGSSLKLLMVAEGSAHVYPRIAPTSEWDTAAAHAIVNAAGGCVLQFGTKAYYNGKQKCYGPTPEDGAEVRYGKENVLNPYFVVYGNMKEHREQDAKAERDAWSGKASELYKVNNARDTTSRRLKRQHMQGLMQKLQTVRK